MHYCRARLECLGTGGEKMALSEKEKRQERRVVLFEWMRRGRGPLAEGLPRVRSPLPRAPSQPSGICRDTPHEVLFTAWRKDQDSHCLMDACCAGAASTDMVRLKCRLTSKRARFSAGL